MALFTWASRATSRCDVPSSMNRIRGRRYSARASTYALLLATGKKRAHVPDQAVVAHRHTHDLVVDPGRPGAGLHPLNIECFVEAADVVGNGTGQELVVLHHHPDLITESSDIELSQRHAIDQDIAGGRSKQTKHDFNERRFSAARWAGDRDVLSGRNEETCVLKYERLVVTISAPGLRSRPVPFRSHQ